MAKFPDEIFDDPSAKELELFDFGNKIPDRIKTLTKVTRLRMGNSNCSVVPDALFQLPKLQYLLLGLHRLKTLPNAIAKATSLRELDLSGTHALKELPDAIGKTKLTELRAIPGGLKKVPAALWGVATLRRLGLPPSVKALPPGISKLTKLETLEVGGEALLSIASELPKLKRLKKLSIELGTGVVLPAELTQLKIENLDLGSHVLAELPELFTKIQTLKELHLYGMFKLKKLADAVEKLPNLTFVNYQKKSLSPGESKRIEAHIKK